jgi:hypothetical protein
MCMCVSLETPNEFHYLGRWTTHKARDRKRRGGEKERVTERQSADTGPLSDISTKDTVPKQKSGLAFSGGSTKHNKTLHQQQQQ